MQTVTQLNVEIGAKLDKLEKGLGEANKKLDNFTRRVGTSDSKMKSLNKSILDTAKGLGLAFGAVEIARGLKNLVVDSSRLAAEAEGVGEAFSRLNRPGLLNELQAATKGTVSDLELMRRAVQANNFQIPVKNLGFLFEFAAKRAQQTGESVEFLTNSIVLGIGRKSPLILDNLGISAVRLREELKGAGTELATVGDIAAAVGKIAQQEMQKAGDIIETTKTKTEQLNASWQNFKLTIGGFFNEGGGRSFLDFLNQGLTAVTKNLSTKELDKIELQIIALEKRLGDLVADSRKRRVGTNILSEDQLQQQQKSFETLEKQLFDLRKRRDELLKPPEAEQESPLKTEIGLIKGIKSEIELLNKARVEANKEQLPAINARIEQLKKELKVLESIGTQTQLNKEIERRLTQEIIGLIGENVGTIESPNLGFDFFGGTQGRFTEDFINEDVLNRTQELNRIINELGQNITLAEAKNVAFGGSYDLLGEKLSLTEQAINSLIESGISPQNIAVQNLSQEYQNLLQQLEETTNQGINFNQVLISGLNSIVGLLFRANDEADKFGRIISSISLTVLSAVLGGGGGGIGNIFSSIFGNIGSFASGGIAVGPQLAVVGDNPGKREAIIPSELFGKLAPPQQDIIVGRIKGQDLELIRKKVQKLDNRTR